MNTVHIYPLKNLSQTQSRRLRDAQMEAAQVWNLCTQMHKAAREQHKSWPERNTLQKATKGRFALHSQSVQMVVHVFLANINTTQQLRHTHPQMRMRYPYKDKPVLSYLVACTSGLTRTGARGVANGRRTQIAGVAFGLASNQWSMYNSME